LLRRHPLEATISVGDHRFDDRLNDPSPEVFDAWLAHLRTTKERLRLVTPPSGPSVPGFSQEDRIALRVLSAAVRDRIALALYGDHLMPLAQLLRSPTDVRSEDLHLLFAQLGEYQPASTAGDVENFVRRLKAFPKLADGLIAMMKRGLAENRVPPRVAM